MIRNFGILCRRLVPSLLYARRTPRLNLSTSAVQFASSQGMPPVFPAEADSSRMVVTEISVHDFARDDLEFARNFTTSLSSLAKGPTPSAEADEAVTEMPSSDSNREPAAGAGDGVGGGGGSGNFTSSVLDKDGRPIVPVDIDGWADFNGDDDDEGPTVQKSADINLDVGNDESYKMQHMLIVPEVHDGNFEYKGIKVTLPKSMLTEKGAYRFRRIPEDFDVADDMRVCKFEKKE